MNSSLCIFFQLALRIPAFHLFMSQVVEDTIGNGAVEESLDCENGSEIHPLFPKADKYILDNVARFLFVQTIPAGKGDENSVVLIKKDIKVFSIAHSFVCNIVYMSLLICSHWRIFETKILISL